MGGWCDQRVGRCLWRISSPNRRKRPEEELFRHGGIKRSSEGRLTSPELGWDRGFILGKHEFTCLYFCAASGVGLAVSARPGPPGRFDGVTH